MDAGRNSQRGAGVAGVWGLTGAAAGALTGLHQLFTYPILSGVLDRGDSLDWVPAMLFFGSPLLIGAVVMGWIAGLVAGWLVPRGAPSRFAPDAASYAAVGGMIIGLDLCLYLAVFGHFGMARGDVDWWSYAVVIGLALALAVPAARSTRTVRARD